MAYNFNSGIKSEGLLKVTGSHVCRGSCNVSQMVQDSDIVSTDK